jgi:peptidyl-prolyl cis-trans isomerase C
MNTSTLLRPHVNGVVLADSPQAVPAADLRQRACSELLRQAALQAGLLPADDPVPEWATGGAVSEAASAAIESLLDRELQLPEPSDEACRRYHAAHAARYARGERVLARHVLFAVTPGVDVNVLRQRAEGCLLDLRCQAPGDEDRFPAVAAQTSNCPSGAAGGQLGWLTAGDCAPEFARELFGQPEVGVLPRLVHSRFGLHVVEVQAREAGTVPAFEAVQSAVAQALRQQAFATALRQYLQLLAGRAVVQGVDLDAAATPLVQ